MGKMSILAAAVLAASGTSAIAGTGFEWGGDVRFRIESIGDVSTHTNGTIDQLFNRDRIRLWASYAPDENIIFKARLTNEFRFYDEGRQVTDAWDPFNELVPDNLYLDLNKLGGGMLNLRVGRQDMFYGNGRVIADGTPLDGSRTFFFNAIKANVIFNAANKLDLLGIYNTYRDPLTLNQQEKVYLLEQGQDESALGLYGSNSQFEQFPFEYYWVFKHEDNSLMTDRKTKEDADFHTFGARVMPKFGSGVSGNLEVAIQSGDHGDANVGGSMLDASLTFAPEWGGSLKPSFTAGYYYLSGGDLAGQGNDESWHPIFSRWPQISELYLYSWVGSQYGVGGWTNLSAPFVGLDLVPFDQSTFKLRYYDLSADLADGPGGGDKRGDLITAQLTYNYTKNLKGHLIAEFLDTGDYYTPGTDDANYVRFQVEYSF